MPYRLFSDLRTASLLLALLCASCGGSSTSDVTTPAVLPASIVITPPTTPIVFGALGRTRQLAVTVLGTNGLVIAGSPITWQSSNPAVATVSSTGLVTALANGNTNISASTGALVAPTVPIGVSQVVAAIAVTSSTGLVDSLRTSTRTQQYLATARDSTGNAMSGAAFAWASTNTAVATVGASTGLVTGGATTGTTSIQATAAGITGSFPFAMFLFPATLTVAPATVTLSTPAATQLFTATVRDSVGANIVGTVTWTSRVAAVASLSNASGPTTTATALSNGTTRVILGVAGRIDSAFVTVTGQASAAPSSISVTVGDFFFRSGRNNSQNLAIDTVAVGGTVTWNWSGTSTHNVSSTGAPTFTGSPNRSASGSYGFVFNTPGTYQYECGIHGASMAGTVVVR